MKPSEVFGVVVRSVGLMVIVANVVGLITSIAQPGVLFIVVPMLLLGIWLLRGAPAIVQFAYPDRKNTNDRGPNYSEGFE